MRIGDVINGEYRLEGLLGESGMGMVFQGKREGSGAKVTLKFLHSHTAKDASSVEKFQDEAKAVGSIDSPHLVPVLDTGVVDDSPYIVRPYLSGTDIGSLLTQGARLHPTRVIPLIRQVCVGLEAALEHGHHHWDLKPQNIFISQESDGEEVVKLLDFGVAKIRDDLASESVEATVSGTTLGLPFYMPLEQIRGVEDRNHLVDIYALGAILYELLTGQRPYDAETYSRLLLLIATTDPEPIQKRRPALGDDLSQVIHKAFSRDPKDRFDTLSELAAALEPLTEDLSHEEPRVDVVAKTARNEATDTLPGIPLAEHVKRAAKRYEERERSEQGKRRVTRRDHPWLYLGLAVACSVVVACLVVGVAFALRNSESTSNDTAVQVDPVDALWTERCTSHVLSKRYDDAQGACSQGLEATKNLKVRASLTYNLGRIAAARGDRDTARQHFEKALALDPDNPAILRRLEEMRAVHE